MWHPTIRGAVSVLLLTAGIGTSLTAVSGYTAAANQLTPIEAGPIMDPNG